MLQEGCQKGTSRKTVRKAVNREAQPLGTADGGEASTGWEGYVGTRGPHAENSHGPKAGTWGAGGVS